MPQGNLLIVDDEPLLLQTLEATLEDCAGRIFVAGDGQAALDLLDLETIHCILCDINMPRMNGVEVLKALRKQGNNVPFIFFTAHGNRDLMLEAAKYGAFDFLDKPFLAGLDQVVERGLKVGTNAGPSPVDADELMSEYQKIIKELEGQS